VIKTWLHAFDNELNEGIHGADPIAIKVSWILIAVLSLTAIAGFSAEGYHWLFLSINHKSDWLSPAFLHHLTIFGDGNFILCLVLLFAHRRPDFLVAVLIAAIIGGLCAQSLKALFEASRPPSVFMADEFRLVGKGYKNLSFPSGHTLSAFLAAGLVMFFNRARWLWLLLLTLATGVGLSRIWLGVHWPIDTLVGAALGLLSALFTYALINRFPGVVNRYTSLFSICLLAICCILVLSERNDYYYAQVSLDLAAIFALYFFTKHHLSLALGQSILVNLKSWLSPGRIFALALVVLSVYRIFVFNLEHFELFYDEAYYYHWSLNPDLGYYSKPPMVAWSIGLGTLLFGDGIFGVRIMAPVWYGLASIVIYSTTRKVSNSRSACIASLVFLCAPVIGFNSEFITTDAPLIFFWALTLHLFILALEKPAPIWWILLGLSCGLGMLSKYTMAALPLAAFLFLAINKEKRSWLLSPWPWMAAVLAGLIFSLNLYWNSQNEWIAFAHTQEISKQERSGLHFSALFEFLAAQLLVFGPLWMYLLFKLGFAHKGVNFPDKSKPYILLFSLSSLLILVLICAQALSARAFPNWAAPWVVGASILVGMYAKDITNASFLRRGALIQLCILSMFYHWPQILAYSQSEVTTRNNPFQRLGGWREASQQLAKGLQEKDYVLASDSRDVLAYVGYYAFTGKSNFARWNPNADDIRDHYDLKNNFRSFFEKDENLIYLFVSRKPLEQSVLERFEHSKYLGASTTFPYPDRNLTLHSYELRGFKGYE
jgi:4-amino-4-deoxy-L-arabinose transferase-like glycosyltransferase/membrane-associated phospholipid phosphatase